MYIVALILIVLALLYGPQWWAQRVMRRHAGEQDHFQGTGGELARHLLDRFGLQAVTVEVTEEGDHYDPLAKSVRLTRDKLDAKSLTAIAVAAHEVGHALQDKLHYGPLLWRTRLAHLVRVTEKLGSGVMLLIPVLALVSRSPTVGLLVLITGILSLLVGVLVHLVTLPVEWDASFRRALPLLEEGYISTAEQRAARTLLTAAAITYVAGSLAGLLNLWRWIAILRR